MRDIINLAPVHGPTQASGPKKYYQKLKEAVKPRPTRSGPLNTVSSRVAWQAATPSTTRYTAVPMPRPSRQNPPATTSCCPGGSGGGQGCSTMTYFSTPVLMGLAVAHVVCGLGMVSIQVTSMEEHAALGDVAAGVWAGTVVIITGCIGLLAAKKDRDGTLIMAFRIMSLVCVLFCLAPLVTSVLEMIGSCWPKLLPTFVQKFIPLSCNMSVPLDSATMFFAIVETVVAIIASKVSCFCCIPCLC